MQIEKKIKKHLIFSGDSLLEALNRINDNQSRIVFVVEENGLLIGALSDGDVRRWITQTTEFNLDVPVDSVMNRSFVSALCSDSNQKISSHFDHKRDIIPLIDEQGRFVALARKTPRGLQLGDFVISDQSPAFIVAEVGNNHNGDFQLAKELIDHAVEANADCVKFQMRDLRSLYSNKGKPGEEKYDLGSQYTLDLLNRFQLSNDQLCQIFDYCKKRGILPLCTPWDLISVRVLDEYGLEGFKVASADMTNFEMLEALSRTGKPLICSTGMSKEWEIRGAVGLLRKLGVQYAMLHCNSTYPTPFKDVNLSYLPRLKEIAGSVVGYSGHERGIAVPIAAVALGAKIVEKHLTIDRTLEGNDHKVSLLPTELSEMVRQIRIVEQAMGSAHERELSQGEMINRQNLAKSLVINCSLAKGQVIQRQMIEIKSPGQGLQPNRIGDVIGKIAHRDFNSGDMIFDSDIQPSENRKTKYIFQRPFGIPVRYHDYHSLINGVNIDFVEFHLSYHDLDLPLNKFFNESQSIRYAVHAPELFAGDHILDLATGDGDYLARSVHELTRTIEVAKQLKQYFPLTPTPVLVVNAGGWSTNGFLPVNVRSEMYERLVRALSQIDLSSIQLAIQTMPPFPWHFGGQSYHNLFVDPIEISKFCESTGHKVCLDISHSMMACNYYKWDMSWFLEKVLPYTIHLHISDAKGIDGEGVQIGEGDVDFKVLSLNLSKYAKGVPFIPEVWQGHKNLGEGFLNALNFLESIAI